MNENPNRIACERCGAANFPSSTNCWQCGEPLRTDQIRVERVEPSVPSPESSQGPEAAPPPPPSESPVYGPPVDRASTENLILYGFICAGIGLFGCCCCCSWAFSVAAIVFGAMAYSRGDNRGVWVIVAGAAGLLLGSASIIWSRFGNAPSMPWRGPFPGPIPGPWRNI